MLGFFLGGEGNALISLFLHSLQSAQYFVLGQKLSIKKIITLTPGFAKKISTDMYSVRTNGFYICTYICMYVCMYVLPHYLRSAIGKESLLDLFVVEGRDLILVGAVSDVRTLFDTNL
jgi:hypothetical protein